MSDGIKIYNAHVITAIHEAKELTRCRLVSGKIPSTVYTHLIDQYDRQLEREITMSRGV